MSVHPGCPETYECLMGTDRFKIFPFLQPALRTVLYSLLEGTVAKGTACLECGKTLEAPSGKCPEGCDVLQNIAECRNCDAYSFPCKNCRVHVFKDQLSSADES